LNFLVVTGHWSLVTESDFQATNTLFKHFEKQTAESI
jgi:hypothetical protein